jgi:AraC family transcriptional regulator
MAARPTRYISEIPFRDSRSGRMVRALNQAAITISSRPLGWSGIMVEAGSSGPWECDDLVVPQHHLGLNTGPVPVHFEAKIGAGYRKMTMAPGAVWFSPAGSSFSHRVPVPSQFALVSISPEWLARHAPLDEKALRPTYDVRSREMGHLIRGLVDETAGGGSSGPLFVEAMVTALGIQIAQTVGDGHAAPAPHLRGLRPKQLARVLEVIDARLATGVSVVELAAVVPLSVSRFTHAFREAVGVPPHQYVIARRLERAREELQRGGTTIVATALRWGFTDQSHFTRLFRKRYGVTPGRMF